MDIKDMVEQIFLISSIIYLLIGWIIYKRGQRFDNQIKQLKARIIVYIGAMFLWMSDLISASPSFSGDPLSKWFMLFCYFCMIVCEAIQYYCDETQDKEK